MSLPAPSLVNRAKRWIRLLARRSSSPSIRPDEKAGAGFFTNAQEFNVNGGNFINEVNGGIFINGVDAREFINELKNNYINDMVSSQQAVFELLEPYTCLDATKDSSARHPPPRCHSKTRLKVRERLTRWLVHGSEEWGMIWVRGSAGTGKSAVAQSFGDSCGEEERHGASYFFSRTTGRDNPATVVPTLVYQLASTIPEYRSLVGHKLANNPLLLKQSSPVQFRELIVGPFATLQRRRPRQPIVIILDGLDECDGENAQLEILEMVANAVRSHPELPLRWLIFSRPEAHLKNAFSLNSACGREELIIDDECREDVERYVKDRLVQVKAAYKDITPTDWPSEDKLQQLLDAVSGLFIFASTCLNFVGDPDEADPPSQLESLLVFMRHSQGIISRNPLAVLDLLYSRILEKIPPPVYETTRRILAYMSLQNKVSKYSQLDSAQALSNFLQLNRQAFYKAARGIYSVASVPEPEDARKSQLQFYHASFQDFLIDPIRSGRFCISEQDALAEIVPLCTYWYEVDATHFHTHDDWIFNYSHPHDCLSGLMWASGDDQLQLSEQVIKFSGSVFDYEFSPEWNCVDQGFLSRLSNVDFRFWEPPRLLGVPTVCRFDLSTSIVRVEPSSDIDRQLLESMNHVIGYGVAKPAKFPLRRDLPDDEWTREYFFIGHGIKSVIVWSTKSPASPNEYPYFLRSDQAPSQSQISQYAKYLQDIHWDEARAKAEMK